MKHEYFAARYPEKLAQMQQNGLETGSYDPLARQ
jgi:hypothetical protein